MGEVKLFTTQRKVEEFGEFDVFANLRRYEIMTATRPATQKEAHDLIAILPRMVQCNTEEEVIAKANAQDAAEFLEYYNDLKAKILAEVEGNGWTPRKLEMF